MDDLRSWIINYLKNKDIVAKEIQSIKKNIDGFDFVLETSKGKKFVCVLRDFFLNEGFFEKISQNSIILVVNNSKKNLDFFINNWQKFILNPKLCIFFVNPKLASNAKWILYPATHNSLIDKGSLRSGLESLFAGVEEVK